VFGRMVSAHGRADPDRLNERDHPSQDRQQVRAVMPLVVFSLKRTSPSRFSLANGHISANVKSASIDH
jgi:hypothetical protein